MSKPSSSNLGPGNIHSGGRVQIIVNVPTSFVPGISRSVGNAVYATKRNGKKKGREGGAAVFNYSGNDSGVSPSTTTTTSTTATTASGFEQTQLQHQYMRKQGFFLPRGTTVAAITGARGPNQMDVDEEDEDDDAEDEESEDNDFSPVHLGHSDMEMDLDRLGLPTRVPAEEEILESVTPIPTAFMPSSSSSLSAAAPAAVAVDREEEERPKAKLNRFPVSLTMPWGPDAAECTDSRYHDPVAKRDGWAQWNWPEYDNLPSIITECITPYEYSQLSDELLDDAFCLCPVKLNEPDQFRVHLLWAMVQCVVEFSNRALLPSSSSSSSSFVSPGGPAAAGAAAAQFIGPHCSGAGGWWHRMKHFLSSLDLLKCEQKPVVYLPMIRHVSRFITSYIFPSYHFTPLKADTYMFPFGLSYSMYFDYLTDQISHMIDHYMSLVRQNRNGNWKLPTDHNNPFVNSASIVGGNLLFFPQVAIHTVDLVMKSAKDYMDTIEGARKQQQQQKSLLAAAPAASSSSSLSLSGFNVDRIRDHRVSGNGSSSSSSGGGTGAAATAPYFSRAQIISLVSEFHMGRIATLFDPIRYGVNVFPLVQNATPGSISGAITPYTNPLLKIRRAFREQKKSDAGALNGPLFNKTSMVKENDPVLADLYHQMFVIEYSTYRLLDKKSMIQVLKERAQEANQDIPAYAMRLDFDKQHSNVDQVISKFGVLDVGKDQYEDESGAMRNLGFGSMTIDKSGPVHFGFLTRLELDLYAIVLMSLTGNMNMSAASVISEMFSHVLANTIITRIVGAAENSTIPFGLEEDEFQIICRFLCCTVEEGDKRRNTSVGGGGSISSGEEFCRNLIYRMSPNSNFSDEMVSQHISLMQETVKSILRSPLFSSGEDPEFLVILKKLEDTKTGQGGVVPLKSNSFQSNTVVQQQATIRLLGGMTTAAETRSDYSGPFGGNTDSSPMNVSSQIVRYVKSTLGINGYFNLSEKHAAAPGGLPEYNSKFPTSQEALSLDYHRTILKSQSFQDSTSYSQQEQFPLHHVPKIRRISLRTTVDTGSSSSGSSSSTTATAAAAAANTTTNIPLLMQWQQQQRGQQQQIGGGESSSSSSAPQYGLLKRGFFDIYGREFETEYQLQIVPSAAGTSSSSSSSSSSGYDGNAIYMPFTDSFSDEPMSQVIFDADGQYEDDINAAIEASICDEAEKQLRRNTGGGGGGIVFREPVEADIAENTSPLLTSSSESRQNVPPPWKGPKRVFKSKAEGKEDKDSDED